MKMTSDTRRGLPLIGASQRRFVRELLLYFIPLGALILIVSFLVFRAEWMQDSAAYRAREIISVKLGKAALVRRMDMVVRDIRYLAGDTALQTAIDSPSAVTRARLTKEFINFSRAKKIYDQVQWIDEAGRERVRVGYRNGRAITVSPGRLRNDEAWNYFVDAFKLKNDEIYLSPFGLNMKNGSIEVPFKPMLRVGMPVFDWNGRKRGIVELSYYGKTMLEGFIREMGGSAGHAEILNRNGYWLLSPHVRDEWGFMFGKKNTFADRYPDAWRRIRAEAGGQFVMDNQVWTFATVYPMAAQQQSSEGAAMLSSGTTPGSDQDSYVWKIVLHAPYSPLSAVKTARMLLTTVMLLIAAFAVSWLTATSRGRQYQNEQAIRRQIDFTEALIDNAAIAMFVLTKGHKVLYWNRACEKLTGMLAASMIGTDDHWKAFYTEKRPCLSDLLLNGEMENIADLYESSNESMLLKGGWHGEGWFEKVGGKRRYLLVDTALIYDAGGTLVAAVETIQDDTGRKKAADQLAADERRFRALFERSSDAIFLVDRTTGRYLDANHSAEVLTGRPVAELRQLRTIDLSIREEAEARLNRLTALNGNQEIGEAVYIRPGGNRREAILNSIALENDVIFGVAHDITDEKRARQSLIASETRFRAIFENSAIAIGLTRAGKIVMVNTRYARLFGYEQTDELAGRSIFDLIAPSERPRIRTFTERRARGESVPDIYETRGLTRAGEEFDMVAHVSVYHQEDKIYSAVVIEDITDRKRSEQLLEKRLELSAYAADHSILDVLQKTLDLSEELTGSSIGFYHYYDEDKGEAILQQWSTSTLREFCKVEGYGLHYSIDLAGVWTDCIRERRPVIHNDYARLPHKKGMPEGHAEVLRELVVPILRKDRIVAYLGVGNKKQDYTQQDVELVTFFADYAWDVAERKMAEIDLAETKQRLELAADSAQMGIWDWNVAEDRVVWNDRMLELYGITRPEFTGTIESWKKGVHPDDLKRATATIEKVFRGENGYDIEYRVVQAAGKTLHIKADGMVIRDSSGQPVRMIGISRDVTEQRLLEEQLRQAQKMEAVGTLAGGVAHDFNNILSVIMGYSNMLEMSLQHDSPFLGDVKNITKAAERASNLTHGLLAFSRKQAVNLRSVDLNSIVEDIQKMIVRMIGEQVELSVDLDAGVLMVFADRNHIDQVILNLAANSRDAMLEGGCLSITTSHVKVGPEFFRNRFKGIPGWYAMLVVTDTGTGMDKATQDRIFEPFFTTKEVGKGTGLGLSMVYGIIKQHNGFIDVESEPGAGAEFRIYLPLVHAFHRSRESQSNKLAIPSGNGTILLVEDDRDARMVTRLLLERFGYTVLQAKDGITALAVYQKHRSEISLVMTDVVMPRMNGRRLYEELRSMNSGIKVLFMSGYTADVVTLRELMDAGLPFLEKPMNPLVMADTIRAIIG